MRGHWLRLSSLKCTPHQPRILPHISILAVMFKSSASTTRYLSRGFAQRRLASTKVRTNLTSTRWLETHRDL